MQCDSGIAVICKQLARYEPVIYVFCSHVVDFQLFFVTRQNIARVPFWGQTAASNFAFIELHMTHRLIRIMVMKMDNKRLLDVKPPTGKCFNILFSPVHSTVCVSHLVRSYHWAASIWVAELELQMVSNRNEIRASRANHAYLSIYCWLMCVWCLFRIFIRSFRPISFRLITVIISPLWIIQFAHKWLKAFH